MVELWQLDRWAGLALMPAPIECIQHLVEIKIAPSSNHAQSGLHPFVRGSCLSVGVISEVVDHFLIIALSDRPSQGLISSNRQPLWWIWSSSSHVRWLPDAYYPAGQ